MILTVVGKPGGGKSFYALKNIARVLAETSQSVVTNLSVDIPALEAYCAAKWPGLVIDVSRRVRLLDEKQAARFWLYRVDSEGAYHDLGDVSRDDEKRGVRVDYASITKANAETLSQGKPRVYPGIFYVIDECHVFFDARAWAETGFSLTFYNSQHRKLDDDVMFVTQFLELIDKRVKGFSQEFIYLRNNGAEKLFTFFRGPSYFSAKHYQRPPSGMQDLPSEVHRFSLDLDLARCYDTSAGVGIKGVGKPEAKKKKGLPVYLLAVPFLLFCAALYYGPDLLAKGVIGTASGSYTAETLGLAERKRSASAPASVPGAVSSTSVATRPSGPTGSWQQEAPPYPTGYLRTPTRVIVQMSDGTWRGERDTELERIERNAVWLAGEKMYFRASPRPAPSPALPSAPDLAPTPASAVDPVPVDAAPEVPTSRPGQPMAAGTFAPSSEIGRSSRRGG